MTARELIEAEVYDPGADHVMDYTDGKLSRTGHQPTRKRSVRSLLA